MGSGGLTAVISGCDDACVFRQRPTVVDIALQYDFEDDRLRLFGGVGELVKEQDVELSVLTEAFQLDKPDGFDVHDLVLRLVVDSTAVDGLGIFVDKFDIQYIRIHLTHTVALSVSRQAMEEQRDVRLYIGADQAELIMLLQTKRCVFRDLPVIINSGSGNQGITASVPVIVYAREAGISEERMYRALVLSNLLAVYQKTPIGRLSAYCGVINAGTAAACGIAYLKGGDFNVIAHTLVNSLAISSGVICDGAKASCAAKIALALDNAFLGYRMYENGQQFYGGDGIVKKGVDKMVSGVGRLGREGMRGTDKEILRIMLAD